MTKMLVAYHSRTGHTQHMAEEVARSAGEVDGVDVDCRPVAEVDAGDLLAYDAMFGTVDDGPGLVIDRSWPVPTSVEIGGD